jgi:Ca2+-binding EF-hand superfamily protein
VLSFEEVTDYFHSLHLGIKEDFSKSVAKYLKGDEVATLWSKLDTNGDGVVSLEDLDLFITSKINEFSRKDASFLHRAIDSNSDGAVSFSEFKSYLHSLKPSVCLP